MPTFSDNGKTSSNLLFIVKTSTTAAHCTVPVVEWLVRVVSQCFPVRDPTHPHFAVVGTLRSDFCEPDSTTTENELLVAMHQSNTDNIAASYFCNSGFEGPVVVEERPFPPPALDAPQVKEALLSDVRIPTMIEDVGVSAVSQAFQKEMWKEIVSTNRTFADGAGAGPMHHRAYYYNCEDDKVHSVGEMSFNFGW